MTPTLLHLWDTWGAKAFQTPEENERMRRALAIAKAVDELRETAMKLNVAPTFNETTGILRRADELLREAK